MKNIKIKELTNILERLNISPAKETKYYLTLVELPYGFGNKAKVVSIDEIFYKIFSSSLSFDKDKEAFIFVGTTNLSHKNSTLKDNQYNYGNNSGALYFSVPVEFNTKEELDEALINFEKYSENLFQEIFFNKNKELSC